MRAFCGRHRGVCDHGDGDDDDDHGECLENVQARELRRELCDGQACNVSTTEPLRK